MKILNLVDEKSSYIKYKISNFPDGQNNLSLLYSEIGNNPVTIKSRLNNWLDLELIVCAVACLRGIGIEEIHLFTPYILGARSDRQFETGGNNYLKDVICPVINSLNFKTVTCIDPHSNCLEMGIKNFRKIDNCELVEFSLSDIDGKTRNWRNDEIILLSPDDGEKKSAKGLLCVIESIIEGKQTFKLKDKQPDWDCESKGALKTVFRDGVVTKETTLEEIRNKLNR